MKEISAVSIVCVIISTLISVITPVVFILIGKIKMKGSLKCIFSGALMYFIVLILKAVIWTGLHMDDILLKLLGEVDSETVRTMIRCVFLALIETVSIWLYFLIRRRKNKKPGNAMVFGSTYAAFACMTYSVLLIMSVAVIIQNAMGNGDVSYSFSLAKMSVNVAKVNRGKELFLCYGLRSLFDTMYFISASILLFMSVQNDTKWQLPVVFLLNIFHSSPALLGALNVWYWNNEVVAMIGIGVIAAASCLTAYGVYLSYYKKKEVRNE